jgi:hypothetical protein
MINIFYLFRYTTLQQRQAWRDYAGQISEIKASFSSARFENLHCISESRLKRCLQWMLSRQLCTSNYFRLCSITLKKRFFDCTIVSGDKIIQVRLTSFYSSRVWLWLTNFRPIRLCSLQVLSCALMSLFAKRNLSLNHWVWKVFSRLLSSATVGRLNHWLDRTKNYFMLHACSSQSNWR